MIWKQIVTQILSFSSLLITVNSYVIRLSPDPQNNVEIQNNNDRLSFRRIGKFISNSATQKDTEITELSIPIAESALTAENDAKILQEQHSHPRRRIKRFTCWHSCLGPWKKKNPKTKAYRYRIKNVGVSKTTTEKPDAGAGGSNEEPDKDKGDPDQNEKEVLPPNDDGYLKLKSIEDTNDVEGEPDKDKDDDGQKDNDQLPPNDDGYLKLKSMEDTSEDQAAPGGSPEKAEEGDEKKEIKRNIENDQNDILALEEFGSREEADGDNAIEIDEEDENYVDPAAE